MDYKIAIVGSPEAIAGFALLGVTPVAAEDPEMALAKLYELKKTTAPDDKGVERNVYAIVFITEDLMEAVTPDDEKKLAKDALPAIIPIPSHVGSTGYGTQRLKRIVERAVGSDILK